MRDFTMNDRGGKATPKEMKKQLLKMLLAFDAFCKENNLTYYLSGGTLLGAVRHKGFIPWDDDIDLYMLRRDYEIFLDTFGRYEKDYNLISLKTDPQCSMAYAKVEKLGTRLIENVDNPMELGINIDIFPVDGVPDDLKERTKYFKKIQRIRNSLILKDVSLSYSRNLFKNIVLAIGKIALKPFSLRFLAEKLDSIIDKNNIKSQYVCNVIMGNGVRSVFKRDAMSSTIDIEFEGKFYKTMVGYDEYLTQTYGDYMQLPPVEKRVSHHGFKAYWKE